MQNQTAYSMTIHNSIVISGRAIGSVRYAVAPFTNMV